MKWAVRGDGGDELRQCRRKAVMIKTEPANSYYGLVRELGKATINICTSFILQNNVFDLWFATLCTKQYYYILYFMKFYTGTCIHIRRENSDTRRERIQTCGGSEFEHWKRGLGTNSDSLWQSTYVFIAWEYLLHTFLEEFWGTGNAEGHTIIIESSKRSNKRCQHFWFCI